MIKLGPAKNLTSDWIRIHKITNYRMIPAWRIIRILTLPAALPLHMAGNIVSRLTALLPRYVNILLFLYQLLTWAPPDFIQLILLTIYCN